MSSSQKMALLEKESRVEKRNMENYP